MAKASKIELFYIGAALYMDLDSCEVDEILLDLDLASLRSDEIVLRTWVGDVGRTSFRTHHEFTRARDRSARLRLYTETNTQIDGFRELTVLQRLGALWHMLLGGGR